MSARRVLSASVGALAIAVATLGLQVAPSYAAGTDLYVKIGGNDTKSCTDNDANACATLQRAVSVAGGAATIHIGAGTFAGLPQTSGQFTMQGAGAGQTFLSGGAVVLDAWSATWALHDLTVQAAATGVGVQLTGLATVTMNDVVLDGGACGLYVFSGFATLTDSVVQNPNASSAPACNLSGSGPYSEAVGEIGLYGGGPGSSVTLVRSRVVSPANGQAAIDIKAGTLTVDHSYLANRDVDPSTSSSKGLLARGGTATLSHSTIHGFGSGVSAVGGNATLTDSTLQGNNSGITASNGGVTVVRSTLSANAIDVQTGDAGTIGLAGSLLGPATEGENCAGTITDLGYNLSSDATCGFTGTSQDNVAGLDLDADLADNGGITPGLPTLAIRTASKAVDSIPAGATYGAPATALCPSDATDQRGVPRPQAAGCDAGSFEIPATTTTATVPATAKPGAPLTFGAHVVLPDLGIPGVPGLSGAVDFMSGHTVLCDDVALSPGGDASCAVPAGLAAGTPTITATYVPDAAADTLHGSQASKRILVGTKPAIKGPKKTTVKVGKKATVTLRATGDPVAKLTVVKGKAPAGMKITRKAGKLTISGKAKKSAAGQHSLKVRATNPIGSSATFTLKIKVKR